MAHTEVPMTALAALADRVGALKGAVSRVEARSYELNLPVKFYHHAELLGGALEGGVCALGCAVAFKDAVLPGWVKTVTESREGFFIALRHRTDPRESHARHQSEPCALVLAVLRALEAQHGEG